jgi:hypothetical protein
MNPLKAWEALIVKEKKSLDFLEALQEARSDKKIRVRFDPHYYFRFVDSGDRDIGKVLEEYHTKDNSFRRKSNIQEWMVYANWEVLED